MENNLFKQFEQLRSAITNFSRSVETSNQSYWLSDWNHQISENTLDGTLHDLWYHEDQDGRETRIYPGLIGLTREQVTFANEVNLFKDSFRKTVNKIKEFDNANWREIQGKLARRYQPVNELLARDGMNRLHLKQVFRHIPLVVTRPEKVGFSWYTSGRSIKKITKKEAYDLLCKLNTDATHIKIQLDRLSSLGDQEPLARVQNQAPVLRANIVFPDKKKTFNERLFTAYVSRRRSNRITRIQRAAAITSANEKSFSKERQQTGRRTVLAIYPSPSIRRTKENCFLLTRLLSSVIRQIVVVIRANDFGFFVAFGFVAAANITL